MMPEILTLKDLWLRKAKEYFQNGRDKNGVPLRSLEDCYSDAQEDFGSRDLDRFNSRWKTHWNRVMDTPHQIVWGDGTYDDVRTCVLCKAVCPDPVYEERYEEIGVRTNEKE